MNIYLIVSSDENVLAEVHRLYQADGLSYKLLNGAIAVGSDLPTAYDVSAQVGISTPGSSTTQAGVVFKVFEHYGMFDAGLWQKLEAWRNPA